MVTIKFINVNGKGQMTVKDSQKENVLDVNGKPVKSI